MYVDSGADITLVPRDFGKLLGLNLTENLGTITGVTGNSLRVSIQDVEVRIASFAVRSKIAVSARNDVPYLLGRNGVFRAFTIVFQEYQSLVRFDTVS